MNKSSQQIPIHWLENGLPYIQNFSPKDYNAEIQNRSIVQDNKGFMYFGNNNGVLVFDGASWSIIQTPSKTIARSLCLINDTVYVGTHFGKVIAGEIGDIKKEIVFHGDTVNTAARIRSECTRLNKNLLLSGDLLNNLKNFDSLKHERIGKIKLKGKQQEVELFSIREAA